MSDRETIGVYDAKASEYAKKTASFNEGDPRLDEFIADCPLGGSVLDLGCGPGISAAAMAQAGLTVTAWDASAEMVALAAQHRGVTAQQAVFDDLTGEGLYDGVWASFSLLHAPRADFPRHLSAIKTALKPGGRLHLGLKLGSGEERDSLGRMYSYYSAEEVRQLLSEAGFTILAEHFGRDAGLSGEVSDWITVAARG